MKAVRKQNKYEHRVSKFSFKKNPRDLPIKSFTLTLWQHSAMVALCRGHFAFSFNKVCVSVLALISHQQRFDLFVFHRTIT